MPNPPPPVSNALGKRMLERYAAGTATRAQLDAAYAAGWISTADYEAAIALENGSATQAQIESAFSGGWLNADRYEFLTLAHYQQD